MSLVRIGFVVVMLAALMWVGCCVESRTEIPVGQMIVPVQGEPSVYLVHGRIIRDKAKKLFSTGWGFRSSDGEHPRFFLLEKYPEEFDANAGFMNERRARLKLKVSRGGSGRHDEPIPAEVLDVVDISKNLSGN